MELVTKDILNQCIVTCRLGNPLIQQPCPDKGLMGKPYLYPHHGGGGYNLNFFTLVGEKLGDGDRLLKACGVVDYDSFPDNSAAFRDLCR